MKNNFYILCIFIILLISISIKIYFYSFLSPFIGDEANIIVHLLQHNIENVMFAFKNCGETAPPLWYFFQKFIANIAGINEYSMRFLSLLFGIINIFVFIKFSKEFLNKKSSIIIALILFAINLSQVRFSAMVKQYIVDVTVSMLFLIYLAKTIKNDSITTYSTKSYIIQFILFCIAYLTSFPAIFIGPTVLFLLITNELIKHTENLKQNIKNLLLVSGANCVALACYYLFFISGISQQKFLKFSWEESYGFFPKTKAQFAQLIDFLFDRAECWGRANDIVVYSILTLIFIGVISYFINIMKKNEKLSPFAILIAPIIVMLFAGAIHIYPFANRLVLFLLPIFIVLIAKTFDYINIKNWLPAIPLTILIFVYFANSNIFGMYKRILIERNYSWSCYEVKEMYKDLKELPSDAPIIVGDCLFLTIYVYNHIYNFKPQKIIYTYPYPNLLTVIDYEKHIERIKNEPIIYVLWSTLSEHYNIDIFKKDLLDENYNVELIKQNETGSVILEKYTKK